MYEVYRSWSAFSAAPHMYCTSLRGVYW